MAGSELTAASKKRLEKVRKILRMFLRDTPELNRLLRTKELEDDDLDIAIELAISDYNATMPPIGNFGINNFPNLYLLIIGSAVNCMRMSGLYQARNELNYQALGSSFSRHNKTNYYLKWLEHFYRDWETKKSDMKIAQNIQDGYGGAHSEYNLIGYDF